MCIGRLCVIALLSFACIATPVKAQNEPGGDDRQEAISGTVTPVAGSVLINEVMAANVDMFLSPAYNFNSWIELFNTTDKNIQLAGCHLTDDPQNPTRWKLPSKVGILPANGHLTVWMGSNNIKIFQGNFELDCEGGSLYLYAYDGTLLTQLDYPEAISRCSYARKTDGGEEWGWTATPTPGASNNTAEYCTQRLPAPEVLVDGGFFDNAKSTKVKLLNGATLYYTTDGTTPTKENGQVSSDGNFTCYETTTYRFRFFQDGMLPSPVTTCSYVKRNFTHTLPVIVVNCPDEYLYDDMMGIYVRGKNGCTGLGQATPVNWNMDWDRPVNFQYIIPDGTASGFMAINQDVNMAISGGYTRAHETKAFKLKANRVYEGQNSLNYRFFDVKPYNRNKTLQVRAGGNDWGCRIKDAALQTIIQRSGLDVDVVSYQPAVHFINGVYKGLINVREPNNKDFAFANWGLSKRELEVYEQSPDTGMYMMIGTMDVLDRIYELSATADNAESYEEIKQLVDIDEYINYMATELYLNSWDWPDNNLKAYRKKDGGRYRYVMFDMDAAFEAGGNVFKWIDVMQWHQYDYIPSLGTSFFGEIRFCTIFLNLLEKNADFRRRYIDAISVTAGSVFEYNRSARILDELGRRVRPTMAMENSSPDYQLSLIRSKLQGREQVICNDLIDYPRMQLTESQKRYVVLSTNIGSLAPLYVNSQIIPYSSFKGYLFAPATLSVATPAGYSFDGWYGNGNALISTEASMPLPDEATTVITARFSPLSNEERIAQNIHPIVVNEVSAANTIYQNEFFKRNDWVELYNTTAEDIDLEGMYLSDNSANPTKWQITCGATQASTIVPAGGYIIIWCDKLEPQSQLHASFKLAAEGGEVLLSDKDGLLVDKLVYPQHCGEETVGRYPDGTQNTYVMTRPTIGKTNQLTSYVTAVEQPGYNGIDTPAMARATLRMNYAAGRVMLRSDFTERASVAIYTTAGQRAMQCEAHLLSGYHEIDVTRLPAGCYVAKATMPEGETVTMKFVKQ